MNIEEIQAQVTAMNAWWRSPDWHLDDPELRAAREAPFEYRAGVLTGLISGGLYMLRGPWGVGKSTEIKHTIRDLLGDGVDPRRIVYVAAEEWLVEDLLALVSSESRSFFAGLTEPRYWFLDEITMVRGDWLTMIRRLRDKDRRFARDTVVLAGSSAVGVRDAREALARVRGRATQPDRTMLPMRFTDVVAAAGVPIPAKERIRARDLTEPATRDHTYMFLPHLPDLVPVWEGYLRFGGFAPAVAGWLRAGEPDRTFVQALWAKVQNQAGSSAASGAQTKNLLASLASGLCSPALVSDIAEVVDVDQATTAAQLTSLADHFLVWPCRRDQGQQANPNAAGKWYFTDPLLPRLASIRMGRTEPDLAQLSEQQLGICLLRNVGTDETTSLADFDALLHFRNAAGAEIDFVSARLGRVAIDSAYADSSFDHCLQTIRGSGRFGVVASRSKVDWQTDGCVIPAPILALILGG